MRLHHRATSSEPGHGAGLVRQANPPLGFLGRHSSSGPVPPVPSDRRAGTCSQHVNELCCCCRWVVEDKPGGPVGHVGELSKYVGREYGYPAVVRFSFIVCRGSHKLHLPILRWGVPTGSADRASGTPARQGRRVEETEAGPGGALRRSPGASRRPGASLDPRRGAATLQDAGASTWKARLE